MPSSKEQRCKQQRDRRVAARLLNPPPRRVAEKKDPKWLVHHERLQVQGSIAGTEPTKLLTVSPLEYKNMSYRHRRAIDFSANVQIGRKGAPLVGMVRAAETKRMATRVRPRDVSPCLKLWWL